MPILEFSDIEQNLQQYDFTEISLCRLAAIYIFFREASQNTALSDEIQQNSNIFAGYFQALQGTLNSLIMHGDLFVSKIDASQIGVIHTEMQSNLDTIYDIFCKLIHNATAERLQLMLGRANQHLIDNIIIDLKMLLKIVDNQRTKIINTNANYEDFKKYIDMGQIDMQLLYQLRDFLNIYLVDLDHKPVASLPGVAVDVVRDLTRLGAGFTGALFGIAARATGFDGYATRTAEDWLKSWNEKHRPLNYSSNKNSKKNVMS